MSISCVQVWLKQPLVDLEEINMRHSIVEAFVGDPTLRESLRDQHLRGDQPLHLLPPACMAGTALTLLHQAHADQDE